MISYPKSRQDFTLEVQHRLDAKKLNCWKIRLKEGSSILVLEYFNKGLRGLRDFLLPAKIYFDFFLEK